MSLTRGSGPLGGGPGQSNYTFDSPQHRILFEPDARRLRAYVGDTLVFDTRGAHLLHETGIKPVVYVPLADLDESLMRRTATSTHCPFKGDASYWSLHVGEAVREDAVWAYEEPIASAPWLRGFAALYPSRVDRWLVEDEPMTGGLRDPYHRVDVHTSSRPVRVVAAGEEIAYSAHPTLVFETSMPPRAYLPRGTSGPDTCVRATRRRPTRTSARRSTGMSTPAARPYAMPRTATSCRVPRR